MTKSILLLFLGFNLCNELKAQYLEVDLRSHLVGNKNYFGIAARTNSPTGHAWVILGRENDQNRMSEISVNGFYPKHDGMPIDKGKIIDEFTGQKYLSDVSQQIIFILNDEDFDKAVKTVQQWLDKPPPYTIIGNNCIDLTQKVAGSIGVTLPSRLSHPLSSTPGKYLELVRNQVYSKSGLVYKKTSNIVSYGSKIYVGPLKNGKANGMGREVTIKDIYVGEFKEGSRNGKGISTSFRDKSITSTQYKGGVEICPCETKLLDGSKIVQINDSEGNPQSQTYTGKDGSTETLIYNGSNFPISGSYTTSKGSKVEILKFYDNKLSSMNVRVFENGAVFEGDLNYRDGHSFQKGHITFQTGDTYDGELRDFKFHGRGRLVHKGERDCLFLGLGCNENSWDIVDDFVDGTSPYLQRMGIGSAPSKSFPDPNEWKVPPRNSGEPKEETTKSTPAFPENSKLDPVPSGRPPRPAGYNKDNSYWDPILKRWRLL